MQNNDFSEFILKEKNDSLEQITVIGKKTREIKFGSEVNITAQQINSLPSISRNLQDYIRLVPQARVNADGGISLAGQNTKFNAFFIDGANINDMLGLAPSGINGGQSGSPPVSIEAIEEMKVSLSPFNVQFSNFTGGTINAITKSGSNVFKSSAWYYFRNEGMAGYSPQAFEVSGSPGVFKRQRLSSFFNQTSGIWTSGPVIKNKLFYFLLVEKTKEQQPQSYNFADYKGSSTQQIVNAFSDTLRIRYGYQPGSFAETKNDLNATRINIKLDWNPSEKNKFSLSYRYNNPERITAQAPNTGTFIRFSNSQYKLIAKTHTVSLEWKAFVNPKINNRLLVTYTNHMDDRDIVGAPFPQVQIVDGRGTIIAGSNGSAQLNVFKGSNWDLSNVIKFVANKQVISSGIDFNFCKLNNIAIGSFFGNYLFASFTDFFNTAFPVRFTRGVSLVDEPTDDNTKGGERYNTRRLGFFISDDIQVNDGLKLTAGLRIDGNVLPQSFNTDSLFDANTRSQIEKYYDLEGARRGQLMNTHWQLSPRICFNYKIPGERLTIRGGAGLFTGHILNLWANELYNVNTFTIDIVPQLYNLSFNPDAYNQSGLSLLGTNPVGGRGNISIVSKHFKYPVVFRTSLSADKQLDREWNLTMECLFTKNIHEHRYTNVNLLPPSRQSALPDKRNVFSLNTQPERIPMSGGNPYTNIILLSNNKNRKGFSYSFTTVISKNLDEKLLMSVAYTYGNSVALFEPNRAANASTDQWSAIHTVNGKNYASLSISDFDLGHRFFASLTKKITLAKNKYSSLATIFYNGQSGSPFSYVYLGSMVNDNGRNSNTDLIYIPTAGDLNNMTFLPYTNSANITYTPQQQKEFLNDFIVNDKYLRNHRGSFAERNGARLPFTHVIDLRLQQCFNMKVKNKELRLSITYDIFNFTNMLNKRWGRIYFLSGDNFSLIRFAGFSNTTTLNPVYQFNPINGKPWSVHSSTAPGNSARWISQVGLKISYD
ncbi:MAG TPA: hypothetical protein VFP97_14540 [Chitinophagaceae bacterium]|nr:hypothetical protein [Chitinophagaceae bacterium]